jgi:hypothetical protein
MSKSTSKNKTAAEIVRTLGEWPTWARESIEEVYFGAKWIVGEFPGGPSPEVNARLEGMLIHYESVIEAIRAFEAVHDELQALAATEKAEAVAPVQEQEPRANDHASEDSQAVSLPKLRGALAARIYDIGSLLRTVRRSVDHGTGSSIGDEEQSPYAEANRLKAHEYLTSAEDELEQLERTIVDSLPESLSKAVA